MIFRAPSGARQTNRHEQRPLKPMTTTHAMYQPCWVALEAL